MADAELIGEWHIGKPFEMPPQWLVDFKENVNTIAQFLIASLELANVVLDVIKTFLVGINDPITALIKALIKEIEKILKDIQQIGLYFTSDRKLVSWPPKDLLGGYPAAEKRMIGRLTDRTDIGRPDVSPNSLMLGFMFYASADTAGFYELITLMNKILKIFSFSHSGNKFATVSNLVAEGKASDPEYVPTYGKFMYAAPNYIEVRWSQKATTNLFGIDVSVLTTAFTKPRNYIVEVSTEPIGIPLYITKQDKNKTSPGGAGLGGENKEGTPQLKSYPVKIEENSQLVDFFLFGGVDRIENTLPKYKNVADKDGKVKPGGAYLHTILPNINPAQPIPIELLKDDSDSQNPIYYLQRTFVLGADGLKPTLPQLGGTHQIKLKKDQLPKAIKITGTGKDLVIEEDTDNPPTSYYFRVTPSDNFEVGKPFAPFKINASEVFSDTTTSLVAKQPVTMGKPCHPYRMQVPRDTTALYQASIESAFISLLLCRPDLDTENRTTPFLEEDKRKAFSLLGIDPFKFYSTDMKVEDFRSKVRDIVQLQTYRLMNSSGVLSAPVEKFVVENSVELREFKWSFYDSALPSVTLRQSVYLDSIEDYDGNSGIAPNTQSLMISNLEKEPLLRKLITIPPSEQATFIGIPPSLASDRMKKDTWIKKIDDIRAKYGYLDSKNPFVSAQLKTVEWLENSVLRDSEGNLVTFREGDVEYVRLFPKSNYYANKKQIGSNTINGNAPLVYNDFDTILLTVDTYSRSSLPIVFTRTALIDYKNSEVLKQAAFVLNIATASVDKRSESEWDYVRLGDMGIFYYIEATLNTILNFVKALMDGLQGIIDAILKFIDYLQQRINEVQNLIRKINALIQSIGLFDLPSVNLLLFASNGTDGVLQDLISSSNKPQDPTSALGFAALALVPIPLANVIVDLFFPDTDINGLLEGDLEGEE